MHIGSRLHVLRYCRVLLLGRDKYGGNNVLAKVSKFQSFNVSKQKSCVPSFSLKL